MKHDPVDVLIIGAGASGAAVAWSLAETKMHILCLDQGGWMNPSEYPSTGRDWEAKFYGDWSSSPNIRGRPEDYPVNDDNSPIKVVNFNGVGGSTVMYTAHWPRLHPSDFKVKTLDGVADDWPIDYDALTPFFEENDRMMGVSGLSGDPMSPLTHPPMPPQPLGLSGPLIGKAMNKLGWHWWPSDTTVATMDYEGRARCINLGHCTPACAQGAKASTDITYWPHAIRAGVEVKTHCRVREILTNEHGMASGVVYYDKDGIEQFQPAEVVIIACNGVGTPRLLLNSVSGKFPNGLANSSGLVGKRLMLHPFGTVVGLFDEDLGSTHGLWGQHIHSLQFYETEPSRGFARGAKWGLQPTGGPLSMTRGYPWGDNPIWGQNFHRDLRKRLGHSAMWGIIAEDLPEEQNRVALDPAVKDADGIPAPKLIYRMSENSKRLLEFHLQRAKESLEAAGAYQVVIAPLIRETGWHILGTCKMGADPDASVVDAWGRCHDVPNLFIFDGSIWPTSSGMNPTATIAWAS